MPAQPPPSQRPVDDPSSVSSASGVSGVSDLDAQRHAADVEEASAVTVRGPRDYWRSITPGRRKAVGLAAVLVLIGSLVAVWFGLASAVGWPIQRDLSYTVHDASSVTVRFEVTKPPEMTAVCEVVAQEVGKAVVGRTEVTIPPSSERTTQHEVTLRTTTLAVIGLAKTCEPAE
ncbi:MAG: DUF4307 domain-containing protein [Dermatophilus congolensis]|nr:DUF4307 domain-containing protein [Dermatophilus congolensis]